MKDSELIKWRRNDEEVIERNVQAFLAILEVNDTGRVQSRKIFGVERYSLLLAHFVQIQGVDSIETRKNLIFRAFFNRLKTYRQQNLLGFRKALAAEVRNYLKRPISPYTVLYPLHVTSSEYSGPDSFQVLDIQIRVCSWESVTKEFETEPFFKRVGTLPYNSSPNLKDDFVPLVLATHARDPSQAFAPAYESAHLLRSILNLQQSLFRGRLQYGYPTPLSVFLPPLAHAVFDKDGRFEHFAYSTEVIWKTGTNSLDMEQCRNAQDFINTLGVPKTARETAHLIADGLSRYGHALDTADRRTAFLMMWQILEQLTLQSSENFSQRQVTSRVNALLRQHISVKDSMRFLTDIRNTFVHHGQFPDDVALETLNILKLVVEQAIIELLNLKSDFQTTASLRRFYDHATEPSAVLEDRARIVEFLLQWKLP